MDPITIAVARGELRESAASAPSLLLAGVAAAAAAAAGDDLLVRCSARLLRASTCSLPTSSTLDSSPTTTALNPLPAGCLEPAFSSAEIKVCPRGCFVHVCLTTLDIPQTEILRSSDGMAPTRLSQQGRNSWSLSRATTEVVSSVSISTKRSRLPWSSSHGSKREPPNLVPPHIFLAVSGPSTCLFFLRIFFCAVSVLQSPKPVSDFFYESTSKSYGDGHSTSEPAQDENNQPVRQHPSRPLP